MSAAFQEDLSECKPVAEECCDVSIILPAEFVLDGGERLTRPELNVRIYGDLALPVIAVAGGVSAGRIVADTENEKGWWREFVAKDGAIDLKKFCVIGFDFLPNDAELARRISTHDQASALAVALDSLNIDKLFAFAGASYGGMVALAFGELFPTRVEHLCIVSAAERAHPSATAVRGVQRRIIQFARANGDEQEGVSLARQLAMITYRTPEEFGARFATASKSHDSDRHDICNYLISRGQTYHLSAERYLALSDSVDRHRVNPEAITTECLFVGARSDRLIPIEDVRRAANSVKNASITEIDSLYGHDAFLKEAAVIGPVIKNFLEERLS